MQTHLDDTNSVSQPRFGCDRLTRLFAASSMAIIGASDRSPWSQLVMENLSQWDYHGDVHLVNRRGVPAHGMRTATSCQEIGERVDLAVLLVPNIALPDALRDAHAAGARGAVVLGAGFGEAGEGGRSAELALRELAQELDLPLIGPNGVGFASVLDRVPAWVSPLPRPYLPGSLGIISQSGNLGLTIANFAARHRIGVSHIVSTGNEINVDLVDVTRVLCEDERVHAVAIFAEAIRDPAGFLQAAERAAELQKPIIILKTGTSRLAAEVAQTHTGALVGDASLVRAAFKSAGIVSVQSIEQLVLSAGWLAHSGVVPAGGLGVVSISGGSNDIIADRAEELGIPLPELASETKRRVLNTVEPLGVTNVMNPFDITGAAVGSFESIVDPLVAVGEDPSVSVLAWTGVPFVEAPPMVQTYEFVGEALRSVDRTGVLLLNTTDPISDHAEMLDAASVPYVMAGIDRGLVAIRDGMWWSEWQRGRSELPDAELMGLRHPLAEAVGGVWDEVRALQLLAKEGISTVPWRLVQDADTAVAAARDFGFPVVVKVAARGLVHKTELGGVVLGVNDEAGVRSAFERVTRIPADVDGAVIAPMRTEGVEMIVGVIRDPQWGLALAIGLGGVHAEVVADATFRLLPVTRGEVKAMLGELRGVELLRGQRNAPAGELSAIEETILRFAELACALPADLVSMEINPLLVQGANVEALDAVIEWQTP